MLLDAPLQSQGGPDRVLGPPGRVASVRGGRARLRPRQLPHQLQEPGGGSGLPGRAAAHTAGPRGLPGRHHAHVKGEFWGHWLLTFLAVPAGQTGLAGRLIEAKAPPISLYSAAALYMYMHLIFKSTHVFIFVPQARSVNVKSQVGSTYQDISSLEVTGA